MKILILTSLYCSLLLTATKMQAGAWPQTKGHGFFKLDYYSINANKIFDNQYKVNDYVFGKGNLNIRRFSLYSEYGLTQSLTFISYIPWEIIQVSWVDSLLKLGDFYDQNLGLSDIDLGFKYGITNTKLVTSVSFITGLPTGGTRKSTFNLGDGELNHQIRLEAGYGTANYFLSGYIGMNLRSRGYSDEFRWEFEYGKNFMENKLIAGIKISSIHSLNNGDANENIFGLYSNNVEYVSPQFYALGFITKKTGMMVQLGTAVMARNVPAAASFSVGIFWKPGE